MSESSSSGSQLSPPRPSPARQPRKRNVVSRDREGCITCRKRHRRCDKAKPECSNCLKVGYACEGYDTNRIAFRDQTTLITQKFQRNAPKKAVPTAPAWRPADAPELENTPAFSSFPTPSSLSSLQSSEAAPPSATDGPVMTLPPASDELWSWSPSQIGQLDDADLGSLGNDTDLFNVDGDNLHSAEAGLYAFNSFLSPTIPPAISPHIHPAYQSFQDPEDPLLFQRLLEDKIQGLSTILPLRELVADLSISATYLYRAVLAVTALSSAEGLPLTMQGAGQIRPTKKQAVRHYTTSLQILQKSFPKTTALAFADCKIQDLFAWLLTRLVLANCDLKLGSLSAWRAHLRAAGKIISAFHARFMSFPKGQQLIQAFARMALLVDLKNDERSVTGLQVMNPGVAEELSSMVERSESPRDRLLALIRSVSKTEMKFRYRPSLHKKWIRKMEDIDAELTEWQNRLPPSELPVDTGVQDSVTFPTGCTCCEDLPTSPSVEIRPLTFPNSTDPQTSAVNYAHFLCARMRARTRYFESGGRANPPDTEAIVLHICRIAAGLSPVACAQAEAFGHGMMPAIAGAYYWTSNPAMRKWIWHWLRGYEINGTREGIWDVCQTRRLMIFLDKETERRHSAVGAWDIIAARIEEEEGSMDEDEGVCDHALMREQNTLWTDEADDDSDLALKAMQPFRIVLHSRSTEGWATDYYTVR